MTVTILYNHDTSLIDSVYLSKSRGLDAARNNRSLTPMTFSVSDSPLTPASIEQEAEKMYPDADVQKIKKEFPEEKQHVRIINQINYEAGIRRSAHITAARMYMGEIERYKKLLEYSHKAKMRIDIPNVTDDELAANWNYFLTQNGLK